MRLFKKQQVKPYEFVLMGDQLLILLGFFTALLAHYRILNITVFPFKTILFRYVLQAAIAVSVWFLFRINKRLIRFFHSKDYLSLIGLLLLIHVTAFTLGLLFPANHYMSSEVYVISFFVTSMYIIFSRLIISHLYSHYRFGKKTNPYRKRLLIYGAGEMGLIVKKYIDSNPDQDSVLLGFLDDAGDKVGRYMEGVKVYHAQDELEEAIANNGITDIVIATKTLTPTRKALFLEATIGFNVRIREIASVASLFNGSFNLERLASLDINDLMNREPIELNDGHVTVSLAGKRMLVTGAAGSIGSEIVRKLSNHKPAQIICVDFSESALYDLQQELQKTYPNVKYDFQLVDIRDTTLLQNVLERFRPHHIYHAAAYKHVPLMEQFPWQAVQTNVMATYELARLAIAGKVEKFVFISSDKAVNPTSVMGATKRLAELIVQSFSSRLSSTSFVVTRFGNVLGSNGSVVPLFKKQIRLGGPVTVTHPEMTRYFMTIAEACQLVLEASVMAEGGEVFVFDMGRPVKIVELARNMIRLAGYMPDVDIPIKFTGLRPGEKLHEELFAGFEKMKETYHEKIMISCEPASGMATTENIISSLETLEGCYDPAVYRMIISKLLPEFRSPEGMESPFNFKEAMALSKLN